MVLCKVCDYLPDRIACVIHNENMSFEFSAVRGYKAGFSLLASTPEKDIDFIMDGIDSKTLQKLQKVIETVIEWSQDYGEVDD